VLGFSCAENVICNCKSKRGYKKMDIIQIVLITWAAFVCEIIPIGILVTYYEHNFSFEKQILIFCGRKSLIQEY